MTNTERGSITSTSKVSTLAPWLSLVISYAPGETWAKTKPKLRDVDKSDQVSTEDWSILLPI